MGKKATRNGRKWIWTETNTLKKKNKKKGIGFEREIKNRYRRDWKEGGREESARDAIPHWLRRYNRHRYKDTDTKIQIEIVDSRRKQKKQALAS